MENEIEYHLFNDEDFISILAFQDEACAPAAFRDDSMEDFIYE